MIFNYKLLQEKNNNCLKKKIIVIILANSVLDIEGSIFTLSV